MAMNLGSSGDEDEVVSAINTTPLVDVMLVLLIIFLITIPAVNYSVKINLPKERNEIRESAPQNIVISVDTSGQMYWYDAKVSGAENLVERLKKVARMDPQPEVHIRGDLNAQYDSVGKIVYACQRAGIAKVGFITEPPPRS
jgi:biopolymer transport protein ExbD